MRRLWPVGLTAAAAVHATTTGNAGWLIGSLYLGVIYVAWLAWRGRDRRTVPPLTREQLHDRGARPPWPHELTRWEDLYREDAEGEAIR